MLVHGLHQNDEGLVFHAVYYVVHFEDGLGKFSFAFDERLERAAHHGGNRGSHARDIHGKVGFRQIHHVHYTLGDVDRLIAHPLQIGIDLGDRENEAQIDRHGLLHSEQIERHLVDFALGEIDLSLALEHHPAARKIALDVGLAGAVDSLLSQSAHTEQTCPKFVQSLQKTGARHYPNLPVM